MEKATLTVQEAAGVLGVSVPTMYEITHRADFSPLLLIGRKRLIVKERFQEWMNQQTAPETREV